jgi:hypothetical protein
VAGDPRPTHESTITSGINTETDTSTFNEQTRNRWDAVLAFRGGYAVDRVLFYGKAGVVWGGFRFSETPRRER